MPKLTPARLDGLHGMQQFSASELHARADLLELDAADPQCADDTKWLLRWAKRVRRLAEQKERAVSHKRGQKR